jgi:ADP-ribose pyrophosphatase YjhB (NUDIX family)
MNKGYTIFFHDRPYFIVSHFTPEIAALTHTAGTIIINHPDHNLVAKTIRDMKLEGTRAVILLTNEVEHFWQVFQSHFTLITAGGGIVENDKNEVLFIFRRGKWDLPKGKLDEGETIEACSIREVKEETGLSEVSIIAFAGNTYHTYFEGKKHVLKTTVWFHMKAPGEQVLIPQTEEDIEKMEWLDRSRWDRPFQNTFPAIKAILQEADA